MFRRPNHCFCRKFLYNEKKKVRIDVVYIKCNKGSYSCGKTCNILIKKKKRFNEVFTEECSTLESCENQTNHTSATLIFSPCKQSVAYESNPRERNRKGID